MAIVNLSLDTNTRQVVLTINGVLVTTIDVLIEKYVDFEGETFIRFSYMVENVDGNGLKERRQFFLPDPQDVDDVVANLNEDGFASKILNNDDKAKADVIDFLSERRKS